MTNQHILFYKIFSVKSYKLANAKFIKENYEEYNLDDLRTLLINNNKCYHLRIQKKQKYVFFGDLDFYKCDFDTFILILQCFFYEYYQININKEDISYTINKSKQGSHHYSIPNLNCSCEKLKEIHTNFYKVFEKDFKYIDEDGTIIKCIDTTIYSEHWFRLPNQSKESNKNTIHEIVKGKMEDFIVEYIPDHSVNIENIKFINKPNLAKTNTTIIKENEKIKEKLICEKELEESDDIIQNNDLEEYNDKKLKIIMRESQHKQNYIIYKKLFDLCFRQERYDNYEDWISVGMSLRNIYGNDSLPLFNYFSSKSKKYDGYEKILEKFSSFNQNSDTSKTTQILYIMAQKDNPEQYKKIMDKYVNTFTETDFAVKLFELAGDIFVYKKIGKDSFDLYCFNGKYWVQGTIQLRKYISNELYEYYQKMIKTMFSKSEHYDRLKIRIESLKSLAMKKNIIETYKEYGVKDIKFDDKWWLFGFTNSVYDLKTHLFREYEKTDYISITTGYDWIEPLQKEIDTITSIINQIMPIEDEKMLYKTILSTSLEGRCLEKFIIFNGSGGNGKGLIDDVLVKSLGYYAITANNSILIEKNKTGSNPEKANLHKKRLIIFREPSGTEKFNMGIIKELSGGGTLATRSHFETDTEKILHGTIICECNKRPLFNEEPQDADVRRIIDVYFRAKFTDNDKLLDVEEYIYKADINLKNNEFQEEHKRALLKIVMEAYKVYEQNKYNLKIPETIAKRTKEYLEKSCYILQWFKENYILTNDKKNIIKLADIFASFRLDEYYENLTKQEKRKFNKSHFVDYFANNIITKKYYKEKTTMERNILFFWKKKDDNTGNIDNLD